MKSGSVESDDPTARAQASVEVLIAPDILTGFLVSGPSTSTNLTNSGKKFKIKIDDSDPVDIDLTGEDLTTGSASDSNTEQGKGCSATQPDSRKPSFANFTCLYNDPTYPDRYLLKSGSVESDDPTARAQASVEVLSSAQDNDDAARILKLRESDGAAVPTADDAAHDAARILSFVKVTVSRAYC